MVKLEVEDIADLSVKTAGSPQAVKTGEAALCLKRLTPDDFVVLLDEKGKAITSLEFASFLNSLSVKKSVVFLIGGVYGAHESLKERADACLSLSAMTFTHQMARLLLVEQIYRALMINQGRSYHY